jgi:urocanate hydratase
MFPKEGFMMVKSAATSLESGMKVRLNDELPDYPDFVQGVRRAPSRGYKLTDDQAQTALHNALRYIPARHHAAVAHEFMEELLNYGRIYGYRYRPAGAIRGKPLDEYKGRCMEGRALQVMIDNNLDFDVGLYPYELVTYGESGQVFQNWMQYRLVKQYLEILEPDMTLVIHSGHPLGLFRSTPTSPRVINTNGLWSVNTTTRKIGRPRLPWG